MRPGACWHHSHNASSHLNTHLHGAQHSFLQEAHPHEGSIPLPSFCSKLLGELGRGSWEDLGILWGDSDEH